MVHVFQKEKREFYDLEGLWGDAKKIELNQINEKSKKTTKTASV